MEIHILFGSVECCFLLSQLLIDGVVTQRIIRPMVDATVRLQNNFRGFWCKACPALNPSSIEIRVAREHPISLYKVQLHLENQKTTLA